MSDKKKAVIRDAQETLRIESEAIQDLIPHVDEDFFNCVQHVLDAGGRIIITGIGKSALIGQKIAATLNSTGTPSFFMHAADAIHGDLGMIQKEDTVMCISKSGNTPEIKVLLPFIRNFGNYIIGLTGNKQSELAQFADFLLYCGVKEEADPNNLAPTASSTAQLAMGDALAVALMKYRGFSPEDFAAFHPGGSLGKQLYLKAGDLAAGNLAPSVSLDTDIHQIILEISSNRLGATAVVDEAMQLLGIITDGDLRRMLEKERNYQDFKARDVYSSNPLSMSDDELAVKALTIMRSHSISQLPILDKEGLYSGMIHLHDLIKEGLI